MIGRGEHGVVLINMTETGAKTSIMEDDVRLDKRKEPEETNGENLDDTNDETKTAKEEQQREERS